MPTEQSTFADTPFFTVLLPIWNREGTLRRCLDSILGQSFREFEVVAVDDGSTDGSSDVVARYQDKRVHLHRHSHNMGMSAARRTAMEAARGSWLVKLDSDDAMLPTALETLHRYIEGAPEQVGVVGLACQYEDGSFGPDPFLPEHDIRLDDWLAWTNRAKRTDFFASYRRCVLQETPFPKTNRGSIQMWLRILSKWTLRFRPDIGEIMYTSEPNRLSQDKFALVSPDGRLERAREFEDVLLEFGESLKRFCPDRYEDYLLKAGQWFFLAGNRGRGAKNLCRRLIRRPWDIRTWLNMACGLAGQSVMRRHLCKKR